MHLMHFIPFLIYGIHLVVVDYSCLSLFNKIDNTEIGSTSYLDIPPIFLIWCTHNHTLSDTWSKNHNVIGDMSKITT